MKLTIIAATLAAVTLFACDKGNATATTDSGVSDAPVASASVSASASASAVPSMSFAQDAGSDVPVSAPSVSASVYSSAKKK